MLKDASVEASLQIQKTCRQSAACVCAHAVWRRRQSRPLPYQCAAGRLRRTRLKRTKDKSPASRENKRGWKQIGVVPEPLTHTPSKLSEMDWSPSWFSRPRIIQFSRPSESDESDESEASDEADLDSGSSDSDSELLESEVTDTMAPIFFFCIDLMKMHKFQGRLDRWIDGYFLNPIKFLHCNTDWMKLVVKFYTT